jgi:hypothetical protein
MGGELFDEIIDYSVIFQHFAQSSSNVRGVKQEKDDSAEIEDTGSGNQTSFYIISDERQNYLRTASTICHGWPFTRRPWRKGVPMLQWCGDSAL